MALELAKLRGTVTVAFGDGEQCEVATFEVPVTTTIGTDGGATLNAAPGDAIRQAMADALHEAANRLIDGLPTAELEAEEGATIIRCADCGTTMAHDYPGATLEHGENGAHIFSPRWTA